MRHVLAPTLTTHSYTNNYLMYFATPNEYMEGGYEASLTLWGIDTAERVRASCFAVAEKVRAPQRA